MCASKGSSNRGGVVYKRAMWWCMKSVVHYNGAIMTVYRPGVYGWGMDCGVWMGARWCND
jgi:hypothetical protein